MVHYVFHWMQTALFYVNCYLSWTNLFCSRSEFCCVNCVSYLKSVRYDFGINEQFFSSFKHRSFKIFNFENEILVNKTLWSLSEIYIFVFTLSYKIYFYVFVRPYQHFYISPMITSIWIRNMKRTTILDKVL